MQNPPMSCIIMISFIRNGERLEVMKKNAVAAVALASALLVAGGAIASAAAYDSSVDPIVTLSYLSNQFRNQILAEVDKRIEAITGSLEAYRIERENDPQPVVTEPESVPSAAFEVVELGYGDILYASSACEIMLRAGTVVCLAPDAGQGLADTTGGYEIYNGDYLTKNHMCLIPRADGRGIIAQSDSVFIMVRGEYYIVKG